MEKVKSNRIQLQQGDSIRLSRRPNEKNGDSCQILGIVGEGGSTICYSASFEGHRGRLKEFYPLDASFTNIDNYFYFRRSFANQLIPVGDGMAERFSEMCQDFVSAYKTLERVKNENADNAVLNNYIPAYQILYGCPDDDGKCTTVYVWTPDDKHGKSFDEYLAEVRREPEKMPVQKLYNIISTLHTLTDCIIALHSAGLLHLDIKPSNFLVPYSSDLKINTANISLFDINTIYSVNSRFPRVSGTDGYRAPEVARGKAENRSDIYSLGAMLFHAIVISDDIENGLYKDEYYNRIEQLVASSKLITASNSTSNAFLLSRLVRILKKCLAFNPQSRYSCCEVLVRDLKTAETIMLPWVANNALADAHQQLVLVDAEQSDESNLTVVLQNLLFKNPLLKWVPPGFDRINVLVLGAGTYGQKFMDICLEIGQVQGKALHITAVSNAPEYDHETYIQFRPALGQFVNVNGSLDHSSKESYGTLNFISVTDAAGANHEIMFSPDDASLNKEIVNNILLNVSNEETYQYIFIALGDDAMNRKIASVCSDTLEALNIQCSVNFALRKLEPGHPMKGNPVCMSDRVSAETIHPELERMALNVHLSWSDSLSLNANMEKVKKKFHEKYNYESSLSFALSIRYKLASIGICDEDCNVAAEKFAEIIKDKEIFGKLTVFEHRRWVVEKLVNGWAPPLNAGGKIDYEGCVTRGSVKDSDNKLHPCLVRSTSDMPLLASDYSAQKNYKKWNDPNIDSNLDELDRMSVELHQCFKKHAEEFRNSHPLHHNADIMAIRDQIGSVNDAVTTAYNRFELCLRQILNGSQEYAKQYDTYEKMFTKSLDILPKTQKDEILRRVKHIHKGFFPVIESNLYRDYKAYDKVLIEKIPFILTYAADSRLAMPFEDDRTGGGQANELFKNVASALVINPGTIIYLYYFDKKSTISGFTQKISSVINYFASRQMSVRLHFVIALTDTSKSSSLTDKLNAIFEDSQHSYEIKECTSVEEARMQFIHSLESEHIDFFELHSPFRLLTPSEDGSFITQVKEKFPYFEFESGSKEFGVCKDCAYLKYITDKAYIRVDDMFALSQATDKKFNLPEFAADYEALWNIYGNNYTGNDNNNNDYGWAVYNWTILSNKLEEYDKGRSPLAIFDINDDNKGTLSHIHPITYFLPDYCYEATVFLLQEMKALDVVSSESAVISHTSDTCRVEIITDRAISKELDKIFLSPYSLADYRFLSVKKAEKEDKKHGSFVKVLFDDLSVEDMRFSHENDPKFLYPILEKLERKGFISKLQWNKIEKSISFNYTSLRIKHLLIKTGEILEIYTYYKALDTGYFDDIVSGYEFEWEKGTVSNEMDCILTKGFRSIIVECKAKKIMEQKDYHRLNSLAHKFGINSKEVMVANIYKYNDETKQINDMHESMGEQLPGHIITVSSPKEIYMIGKTLQSIMEGKYHGSKNQ